MVVRKKNGAGGPAEEVPKAADPGCLADHEDHQGRQEEGR